MVKKKNKSKINQYSRLQEKIHIKKYSGSKKGKNNTCIHNNYGFDVRKLQLYKFKYALQLKYLKLNVTCLSILLKSNPTYAFSKKESVNQSNRAVISCRIGGTIETAYLKIHLLHLKTWNSRVRI